MTILLAISFSLLPYLIGSIPFGLLLTRMAGHGDIRKIGSGNIGATNVMRTGNKKLAAATLLLDGLKGFFAVAIALHAVTHFAQGERASALIFLASICALMGHIFPVWLQFKGGKGVATAIGIAFALSPKLALAIMALWLGIFLQWRISSLSALSAFLIATLCSFLLAPGIAQLMAVITLIIFITHRQNIGRLMRGEEYVWSKKK
ncbi:MAG TPA: glycerol-3-phosphate 1-O-acyltransferase PlsY [Rickettsiales bacterium]|nr:glycerol-3-phosphate 1-O-acyltransferase PlsY [Rickettsiales bacterium]